MQTQKKQTLSEENIFLITYTQKKNGKIHLGNGGTKIIISKKELSARKYAIENCFMEDIKKEEFEILSIINLKEVREMREIMKNKETNLKNKYILNDGLFYQFQKEKTWLVRAIKVTEENDKSINNNKKIESKEIESLVLRAKSIKTILNFLKKENLVMLSCFYLEQIELVISDMENKQNYIYDDYN